MAEFKETTTVTEDKGVDPAGVAVEQQTRRVSTEATPDSKTTMSNIVWYILGFIIILLGIRFVLKLLGANPSNGFVDFIYTVSGALSAPFDTIFGVAQTQTGAVKSVFEPSILVAMAVYALIAWGIVKLLNINRTN